MLVCIGCSSSGAPAAFVDAAVDAIDAEPPSAVTAEARFGATVAPFDRAFYGASEGTLYIEVHAGGSAECPTMTSPTPDRTLVIAGLPSPFTSPRSYADGVRASLLDFKGTITKEPILRATAVTATPRGSGATFVALDLDATYPGGSIAGYVYATHCASMD